MFPFYCSLTIVRTVCEFCSLGRDVSRWIYRYSRCHKSTSRHKCSSRKRETGRGLSCFTSYSYILDIRQRLIEPTPMFLVLAQKASRFSYRSSILQFDLTTHSANDMTLVSAAWCKTGKWSIRTYCRTADRCRSTGRMAVRRKFSMIGENFRHGRRCYLRTAHCSRGLAVTIRRDRVRRDFVLGF